MKNILQYKMTSPCDQCPFRRSNNYLHQRRRKEIAKHLQDGDAFICHKTIDYDDPAQPVEDKQHCAGAMISLLRDGIINLCMGLAEAFVPGFEVRNLEVTDDVMPLSEFETAK